MKLLISIFLMIATSAGVAAKVDAEKFLNHVILTVPPEYFGDIPLEDRGEMLALLNADWEDGRLDYADRYLNWSVNSERDQGTIEASRSVRVKLLMRGGKYLHPYPPYVFIHLYQPADDESAPLDGRTYVLRWRKGSWWDVTDTKIPESVDRSLSFMPMRDYDGIRIYVDRSRNRSAQQLLTWKDEKLQLKEMFPYSSDCTTDEPFDASELATLALTPGKDSRRLMWLIVYAGLEKDERFRYLLTMPKLRENRSLALALASYEYALDQSDAAIDFITGVMKEEGGGDTNSLLIIGYIDEWDRTLKAYHSFGGNDGAAAESKGMFMGIRRFLFPENFEKHRDAVLGPRGRR